MGDGRRDGMGRPMENGRSDGEMGGGMDRERVEEWGMGEVWGMGGMMGNGGVMGNGRSDGEWEDR